MSEAKRRGPDRMKRFRMVLVVLLAVGGAPGVAGSQSVGLPHSQSAIPLSTGNDTFEIDLDVQSMPTRPRVRVFATPDPAHADMTLAVEVRDCPFFQFPCTDPASWSSDGSPGAVELVAEVWECTPTPHDPGFTGPDPTCRLRVTASDFGAAGSPATFDLDVEGETKPVTGTIEVAATPGVQTSGDIDFDRVNFITDAANFRWIYDAEDDDIVETFEPATSIQRGVCEVTDTSNLFNPVPYTYTFVGDPGFAGFDCCTWQMDSPDTMTTGSGQALFYVNVGLGSPPDDTDGDGFFDPCDNCVDVPNGPFLGTCVQPDGTVGSGCLSDQQCNTGIGEFCSMAQEDNDFDSLEGLVCLPEPSIGMALAAGLFGLTTLCHRRLPKASRSSADAQPEDRPTASC